MINVPVVRRLVFKLAMLLLVVGSTLVGACDNSGEEGGPCKSSGFLGAPYCDAGLICNAAADSCEKPMNRGDNEPCSSSALCKPGFWCDIRQSRCRPGLREG